MLNFPVSNRCSRERVAVNMQGTVFTLAKLKIVPSYYQELVSPSMPEPIEALGYSLFSLKITPANFPRELLTAKVACVSSVLPLGLRICNRFRHR